MEGAETRGPSPEKLAQINGQTFLQRSFLSQYIFPDLVSIVMASSKEGREGDLFLVR